MKRMSTLYSERRLGLHTKIEMKRVDKLLHGCLTYAAHERAALSCALVLHYLKLLLQSLDLFDIGTISELGGDIDHHHYDEYEYRKPMTGEKIARNHLSAKHSEYVGRLALFGC